MDAWLDFLSKGPATPQQASTLLRELCGETTVAAKGKEPRSACSPEVPAPGHEEGGPSNPKPSDGADEIAKARSAVAAAPTEIDDDPVEELA